MSNYEEIDLNVNGTETRYDKAQSAVLFSCSTGDRLRTTVGFRQWYLLPYLPLENHVWMAMKVITVSEDILLPTSVLQITLL